MRNDLMAAWCGTTLVVEAGERSGARLQARLAVKQGRRVLLCPPTNEELWARDLVREGLAYFVTSLDDVLEHLQVR
jgi:DNA processing protein